MTTPSPCSAAEIARLLEEHQSSALSLAEFARQRGVPAHQLYWARRKARTPAKKAEQQVVAAEFREVMVRDCATHQPGPLELRLPRGISIGVTRDFDEVTLRRLLGLLAPC